VTMTAVAIFVKTPGHSLVKTRLAADIGRDLAEQWHLRSARVVADLARASAVGPVYWAVAEASALTSDLWADQACIGQGLGDLGQRMATVYNELRDRHGRALLLGADTPQVDPESLQTASAWLESDGPRLCIGPACDGGFWTFGGNVAIAARHWQGIEYGSQQTREQFLAGLGGLGAWLALPALTDFDVIGDLDALVAEIRACPPDHPARQDLLDWLTTWTQ